MTLDAWAESSQAHTSHKRELPNMAGMRMLSIHLLSKETSSGKLD